MQPNALNAKLDTARRSLLRVQAVIAHNAQHPEAQSAKQSKKKKKAGDERPQHRTGFLGLWGEKVGATTLS